MVHGLQGVDACSLGRPGAQEGWVGSWLALTQEPVDNTFVNTCDTLKQRLGFLRHKELSQQELSQHSMPSRLVLLHARACEQMSGMPPSSTWLAASHRMRATVRIRI